MKVKNAKRIISIMLAFVLTLVFAISVVYIVDRNKTENNSNIEVSAALSGSGTQNDPFLINDFNDFKEFVLGVNNSNYDYYYGVVKLTQDINCNNSNIDCIKGFEGVFEGNGKVIKNFTLVNPICEKNCEPYYGDGFYGNLYKIGLFTYASEIYRLGLENVRYNHSSGGTSVFGTLACVASEISECYVKNVTITGDVSYSAAIAASANIENCYVGDGLTGIQCSIGPAVGYLSAYVSGGEYSEDYDFVGIDGGYEEIRNCVVNSKNNKFHQGYEVEISNIKNKAEDSLGLDCSSLGVDNTIWYWSGSYNNGYPFPRCFIKWKTLNISANPSEGGSVSPVKINVPSDATITPQITGATMIILDQEIVASEKSGYKFESWSGTGTLYMANFTLNTYTLRFENVRGTINGDTISPSSSNKYTVKYDTEITKSKKEEKEGSITLEYTFYIDGLKYTVTYGIDKKYDLISEGDTSNITKNRTITPSVELKKYDIALKTSKNEAVQTWEDILYGTEITIKIENLRKETGAKVTTSYSSTSKEYLHNTIVGVNVNSESYADNTIIIKVLTENLNIIIQVRDIYTITMDNAQAVGQVPTGYTASASKEDDNTLKVIEGENITCTMDGQDLTYTSSTATRNYTTTYKAMDGYVVYTNATQVGSIKPTSSTSITPKYYFYVCRVIINNTNTTAVAMKDGSNVTNSVAFNVDYGTEITFTVSQTNGIFTYEYKFTKGGSEIKTITFTSNGVIYAMGTLGWEDEERIWATGIADIKFSGDYYEFKDPDVVPPTRIDDVQLIISPIFGLKSYNVELG